MVVVVQRRLYLRWLLRTDSRICQYAPVNDVMRACSYTTVFWLCWKCLYGFDTRDAGRYEVVQVICRENGAHGARKWGGGVMLESSGGICVLEATGAGAKKGEG